MSMVIRDELVREALAEHGGSGGGGVVGLETAVLTHGLEYPINIEAVLAMKGAVVASGGVPAVIGVLDGELVVGLSDDEVVRLGSGGDEDVLKLTARDLGFAIGTGASGGTTVAGTLVACRLAGIRVFATGGIGGVHRGWSSAVGGLDISADLDEIAGTACAVVCSGAKSILDVGATLELLETRGVPVLGYGVDLFPQFYSLGAEGVLVPRRVDGVDVVARICAAHWEGLGMRSGVLVANPVPREVAIGHVEMEGMIEEAVVEARESGVGGRELTPFLLGRLAGSGGGVGERMRDANVGLLVGNAGLAGEIAVGLRGGG